MKKLVSRVSFKFGSNPTSVPLEFEPESLTVFVGPNNSGKSLALDELRQSFVRVNPSLRLVDQLKVREFRIPAEFIALIE